MSGTLYNALHHVLPNVARLEVGVAYHLKAPGFMDLVVEILWTKPERMKLSLAHYYTQNGDLMRDPEMEVLVIHATRTSPGLVQAYTYRQDGLGIHQVSRYDDGSCRPRMARDHDAFLRLWLRNLREQGHRMVTQIPQR